ncbi:MAG: signal peptidase II [Lachnospiraceae bacterium]|nr:signal peptidase II [Lachnospiraceae bacterium]
MNNKLKKNIIFSAVCAALIAFDQWTKAWMVANLKGKPNIVWIKNVFELEYLENTGAAFSSFSGRQVFLLVLTMIILIGSIVEFLRIPADKKYGWLRFSFALLIAGAIGNMIDRFKQGYVVDFLYFVPINFPRFNVADCYITVSAILLAVLIFLVYSDADSAFLFFIKNTEDKEEPEQEKDETDAL